MLITYSHMGVLFPQYGGLVTGGAIGDGLFFFCSGFTLFWGRQDGFVNWYKRRINRIYPTIIMWALLSAFFFNWQWSVTDLITTPHYWFIPCIMVYYVVFYLIRTYMLNHLKLVFIGVSLIILGSYFFVCDLNSSVMYADVDYMRIYYFSFMLLGASVAIQKKRNVQLKKSIVYVLISLLAYYACMAIYKIDPFYCRFQIISLIPLLSVIYWIYRMCEASVFNRLLEKKIGTVIYFVSCLTLEIYMVQYAIFTDKLNSIFPANILLTYIVIIMASYLLKCMSKVFSQIFSENAFDWRKIYQI